MIAEGAPDMSQVLHEQACDLYVFQWEHRVERGKLIVRIVDRDRTVRREPVDEIASRRGGQRMRHRLVQRVAADRTLEKVSILRPITHPSAA